MSKRSVFQNSFFENVRRHFFEIAPKTFTFVNIYKNAVHRSFCQIKKAKHGRHTHYYAYCFCCSVHAT